ncbi:WXG100 family type VII secretion target [Paractinoplanes atraurantiacus]|uniref:Outer membrane channel protein CpnT-like N-terminal domain-containing protein n=1 Tax=Paractinoplanes atraurantiacus TaxID=1036182 RepID=A0A285J3X2_9ACTN|nr:hypothetical protein [Actinoplanes atraurantiacus]SNY54902.1 hypothetical protein SAMN05421748_115187 [Actinoplanes atraurantiacus]
MKPLSDALDALAGDPDQIAAFAQTWSNVSRAVTGAQESLHEGAVRQLGEWTGVAARGYRHVAGEHEASLRALSKATAALGEMTAGAGMLVATVRMMVRDLIADFVSVLAVRLWKWLAEAGLTLGLGTPWVVTQVTTLVGKWLARIARLLDGLVASLRRLGRNAGSPGARRHAARICSTVGPIRCADTGPPARLIRPSGTPRCGRPRRPVSRSSSVRARPASRVAASGIRIHLRSSPMTIPPSPALPPEPPVGEMSVGGLRALVERRDVYRAKAVFELVERARDDEAAVTVLGELSRFPLLRNDRLHGYVSLAWAAITGLLAAGTPRARQVAYAAFADLPADDQELLLTYLKVARIEDAP